VRHDLVRQIVGAYEKAARDRGAAREMSPAVDIVVTRRLGGAARLEDLAARAVEQSSLIAGAKLAKDCELCIVFCDDAEIRGSTRNGAGRQPTNVLSFRPRRVGDKALLGDIVIAFETVAREAREQDKSLADHASHMIIHGFLHLIGYDHETPPRPRPWRRWSGAWRKRLE